MDTLINGSSYKFENTLRAGILLLDVYE